jgi:hypothetical protein
VLKNNLKILKIDEEKDNEIKKIILIEYYARLKRVFKKS